MKKGTTMNKFFKTIILLLALTFSVATFTGCAQSVATNLDGSYFLKNKANTGIGNVNETVNYDVSFTQSADTLESGILIAVKKGTYTTTLTSTVEPQSQTPCYKLETLLTIEIEYTLGETVQPVKEDVISTTTYFLGVKDRFKTLSSHRNTKTSAPIKTDDGFVIKEYEYTITTTYANNSASVEFNPIKGEFSQGKGTKTYDKLDKPAYYFDNEVMLMVGRAINFTDSSSLTFSTIDPLSATVREMKVSSDATTPTEKIQFKSEKIPHAYMVNGFTSGEIGEDGEQLNLNCRVVNFAINGTFTGTPIKCWYTDSNIANGYARLIKMQTSAPYGLGTFTYIVTRATYND